MPVMSITITDVEYDSVAASLPGDAGGEIQRVTAYLEGQIHAVCEQHVMRERKNMLRDAGIPEALADTGLDDDELIAIQPILSAKRAEKREVALAAAAAKASAIEAAKALEGSADPVVESPK